jgi:LacI family transcriptional regulator
MNATSYFSPRTRHAVITAAAKLGYRLDRRASCFVRRKSDEFGILLGTDLYTGLRMLAGIVESLQESRYSFLLSATRDLAESRRALAHMAERRVAGFIVYDFNFERFKRDLRNAGLPAVVLAHPRNQRFNCVCNDSRAAGRMAVEHLAGLGHTRLGVLLSAAPSIYTSEKLRGIRESAAGRGVRFAARRVPLAPADVRLAVKSWIKGPARPTALILDSSMTAVVHQALLQAGIQIPGDMATLGFNDFENPHLLPVPPSVIAQQTRRMGRLAALRLLTLVGGQGTGASRQFVPPELIVRRSCGAGSRIAADLAAPLIEVAAT